MSHQYELVVFDWEGTIADTLGVVLHAVVAEGKALGLGELNPEEVRPYVELGLVQALKKAYPELSYDNQSHLVQAVQQALHSRHPEVCLMPGARELIEQLHQAGVHLAIATNKGQQALMRALHSSGLDLYFKVTRSAGQVPPKPCPQMLEEIMDFFGTSPAKTLMIGDSPADMEMAAALRVKALGVDFYRQQAQALKSAGAAAVFEHYEDLARFLHLN